MLQELQVVLSIFSHAKCRSVVQYGQYENFDNSPSWCKNGNFQLSKKHEQCNWNT